MDKRLKRLSREALLEMLLEQSKEMEQLKKQNQILTRQLEERQIILENAGSIAEAALALNHIFEVAQKTADQYIDSVQKLCESHVEQKRRKQDVSRKEKDKIGNSGN